MVWGILGSESVRLYRVAGCGGPNVTPVTPQDRRGCGLRKANEVREASMARFVTPTRRRITEGWELSLLPQKSEGLLDGHPNRLPGLDSGSAAPNGSHGQPLRHGMEEPPRCCSPKNVHHLPVMQAGQLTDPLRSGFVGANRLFAGLVLHQVRPLDRPTAAPQPRIDSSRNRSLGPVSAPDPASVFALESESERPLKIAQGALSGPPVAPIETLLAELARRRLRNLAAKKRTS